MNSYEFPLAKFPSENIQSYNDYFESVDPYTNAFPLWQDYLDARKKAGKKAKELFDELQKNGTYNPDTFAKAMRDTDEYKKERVAWENHVTEVIKMRQETLGGNYHDIVKKVLAV